MVFMGMVMYIYFLHCTFDVHVEAIQISFHAIFGIILWLTGVHHGNKGT